MTPTNERFAAHWVATALLYFIGAVALGIVMASSHDFRLKGLHVHLSTCT
jgi:hypothetical protein